MVTIRTSSEIFELYCNIFLQKSTHIQLKVVKYFHTNNRKKSHKNPSYEREFLICQMEQRNMME